ncbi:MAG TPA: gluconate 2-dehydrogenase subunit 3 family protein [Candidatus Binatia bacterium]|nr:gluconate 2-dehydrogenase subunit 3 family protein [Candidatus Binatia bacterium]
MLRTSTDVALTRRQVLQLGAATAVVAAWPTRRILGQLGHAAAGPLQPFLSAAELAIIDAASARIIPTDTRPGAHEAGVADYIQGLLSNLPAIDANCDGQHNAADLTAIAVRQGTSADAGCAGADVNGDGTVDAADLQSAEQALFVARPIFAGGPFSGRQPFGDFAGARPTDAFPAPSFHNAIPLSRIQRLAWTVHLDGAASVPEVADNPLATSLPDVNLRQQYRDGTAKLDQLSQSRYGKSFVQLTGAQQDQIMLQASDFTNLLTGHTIEGLLSDPIYGGNRDRIGWQLIGFDGDSQPLGYTLGFDEATQQYIERADKPNSGPNPDETCGGFSAVMTAFLTQVSSADTTKPNKKFPNPFCFGVTS